MNASLREEDAFAIDLLLDHGAAAAETGVARFTTAHAGVDRVRSAERVLGLLQSLPDVEPPQDLLARTLDRLERAEGAHPASRQGVPVLVPTQQHA